MRKRSIPFAAMNYVRADSADLLDPSDVLLPVDIVSKNVSRAATLAQLQATGVEAANVVEFGADPTGATDSTEAFQAAAAAASAAGTVNGARRLPVYMPPGTFLLSDTVSFDERIPVFGAGIDSTEVLFVPTSGNKPCFEMSEVAPYHYFGGFRDFALRMSDYTYDGLTGIKLGQVTRAYIQDVHIQVPGVTDLDYVAIEISGKEQVRLARCSLQAPVCLYISSKLDNSSFRDMTYMSGTSGGNGLPNTYPPAAVYVDSAYAAQGLTFDGHQTCVGKGHFLYYYNESGEVAEGFRIYNLRTEQPPNSSLYAITVSGSNAIRNINLSNCKFSGDQGYLSMNAVTSLSVSNTRFETANTEVMDWTGSGHFNFDRTCTFFTGQFVNLGSSYDQVSVGGAPTGLRDSMTWPLTWQPWTGASSRPVSSYGGVYKTANVGAATLNAFGTANAPTDGQTIVVWFGDSLTTVDFTGTTLHGNNGVDWAPTVGDHMTCTRIGSDWYCNISEN